MSYQNKLFAVIFLLFTTQVVAEKPTEEQSIKNVLQLYIDGTSFAYPEQIEQAFHRDANLLLAKEKQPIWKVSAKEYTDWFRKFEPGTEVGRTGEIINIDVSGDIATAKVNIHMTKQNSYYVDLFLLKKIDDRWQIISKTATKFDQAKHRGKILFIVSSAHFHGASDLPTGVSYLEIVKAHQTFTRAGYSVDFVSPNGGAIPLAYIHTSDTLAKEYLYDSDFMYSIKNTKSPAEVNASEYKAVHYVGGGNAMYGVPQNKALQEISRQVYEDHNGIISSVCHGTAGIAFLKLKNGEFLVSGKRISGYPDEYERKDRPYFKEFPFQITQTIEKHGGDFKFGARNTPYVEVDGRIVTGQNHLSSVDVAQEIIEILDEAAD